MENENISIEQIRENRLAAIKEAIDTATELSTRFDEIYGRISVNSAKIVDHYRNGDLQDQKRNSELWHELNNIVGGLLNFSEFVRKEHKDIKSEITLLHEELTEIRPPKDPPAE